MPPLRLINSTLQILIKFTSPMPMYLTTLSVSWRAFHIAFSCQKIYIMDFDLRFHSFAKDHISQELSLSRFSESPIRQRVLQAPTTATIAEIALELDNLVTKFPCGVQTTAEDSPLKYHPTANTGSDRHTCHTS